MLQALLAYLLAACGEEHDAVIPAHEIVERFHIPEDQLEEHLQLLNLVNFGGGCYTVYAALEGDEVHVDKELYGDTFRLAPRLTPLEARAIRLALEFVGPMIAADAHTPLDRVRREARGDVRPVRARADTASRRPATPKPTSSRRSPKESASGASSRSSTRRKASRRGRSGSSSRTRSSASSRTGACTRGIARATPSAASGSTGCAARSSRTRRSSRGRRSSRAGCATRARAKVLYAKGVAARWAAERGATPLKDGTALAEMPVGSQEWLIGEILSQRGRGRPARARGDARRGRRARARARERARRLPAARARLARRQLRPAARAVSRHAVPRFAPPPTRPARGAARRRRRGTARRARRPRSADVAERDERVAPQVARVVARHVQALVALHAARRRRRAASRPAARAARAPGGASAAARRFSIPRFHGQTSWQMSQP